VPVALTSKPVYPNPVYTECPVEMAGA
jgi:hypothetical protein